MPENQSKPPELKPMMVRSMEDMNTQTGRITSDKDTPKEPPRVSERVGRGGILTGRPISPKQGRSSGGRAGRR